MSKGNRKHHHLITSEITFVPPGGKSSEDIRTLLINGVLLTNSKGILLRDIGKAQQIVQLNLHNSLQDDKSQGSGVEVMNVIITNISYLGFFSEEEWKAPPEGTKLAEKSKLTLVQNESTVNHDLTPEQAIAAAQIAAAQNEPVA